LISYHGKVIAVFCPGDRIVPREFPPAVVIESFQRNGIAAQTQYEVLG